MVRELSPLVRIGFMASEEMSFENVDDGRRMSVYTIL